MRFNDLDPGRHAFGRARRRLFGAASLALAVLAATGGVAGATVISGGTVPVAVGTTSTDNVSAPGGIAIASGGCATGTVAVSTTGCSTGTVAISGTSSSSGPIATSGTGSSTGDS